jgi:hypothetical protein
MTEPTTAPKGDLGSFDCSVCGQTHDSLPTSFAFALPDFVNKMMPWDRESRCQMTEDWCVVDGRFFYIRGCLELPIKDSNERFVFGAWSTLSQEDFERTMEFWQHPDRQKEAPYIGSFANTVPLYPETRNLKTHIHTRKVGQRPLIKLESEIGAHPLVSEQKKGIDRERIIHLAQIVLHGAPESMCPP